MANPNSNLKRLRQRSSQLVEQWRTRLADINALPLLTLLGLLSGILAGLVIVAFRLLVELPLAWFLPEHGENFEGLSPSLRFLLPLTGALVVGFSLQWLPRRHQSTGVAHVLDRIQNHQSHLPAGNLFTQFLGGALTLLSGHSAGREGPAVHLGAGSASLFGQWLKLPNNSLRPLAACGVAAAIAASFNTPLAGVIFAMEVVLMEYTIAGFIPVILAAVAGSTITQLVFGPGIVFSAGQELTGDLGELPVMALMGLLVGVAAAGYSLLHTRCASRTRHLPVWLRFAIAGLVAGLGGLALPQIMGMGYDTIDGALSGNFGFWLLAGIVAVKLLVTAITLGLGIPGGVIGPCLVMGACLGGAAGLAAAQLLPIAVSEAGVYAILGMGAMMGAVVNAPLAAMIAILELTYNPGIIFPGMLVVVIACLTSRALFASEGLFVTLLQIDGKYQQPELMQQLLSRAGVRSIMQRSFRSVERRLTREQCRALLHTKPEWLLLTEKELVMSAADLVRYLEQSEQESKPEQSQEEEVDLLEIPAPRRELLPISPRANLYQAWQLMQQKQIDALVVEGPGHEFSGIITLEAIESYYRI